MLLRNRPLAICLFAAAVAVSFAAGALAQDGPKASFDCKKAATPVEKAICEGNYTAQLDVAMDELYRGVLGKAEGAKRTAVETAQRQWLAARSTRCGQAKPNGECLARLYKDRIVALSREWRALGGVAQGSAIAGRYAYREKGEAGEMLLAEMPDGSVFVLVETVNVNHRSPHSCTFDGRLKTRNGDVLEYREPETSKTCGFQISVNGNRLAFSELPKDCFELSRHYCGMHGFMLGNYVKR